MKYNEIIAIKRDELRLSKKELAEILGIELNKMILIEKGELMPSLDEANKICEALKISLDELYKENYSFNGNEVKESNKKPFKIKGWIFIVLAMLQIPLHFIFEFVSNLRYESLSNQFNGEYSLFKSEIEFLDNAFLITDLVYISIALISLISFVIFKIHKEKSSLIKFEEIENYQISFIVTVMNLHASIYYFSGIEFYGLTYLSGALFGFAIYSLIKMIFISLTKLDKEYFIRTSSLVFNLNNVFSILVIACLTFLTIYTLIASHPLDTFVLNLIFYGVICCLYLALIALISIRELLINKKTKKNKLADLS